MTGPTITRRDDPCWPGPPCGPLLWVNREGLAEMEAETRHRRRCLRCDLVLDPATYAGQRYARCYCSMRCVRSAARLRDIARSRERARTAPPMTPEQAAAIGAQMRAALAAMEAAMAETTTTT